MLSPNRYAALDDIDESQEDQALARQGDEAVTVGGRRTSARLAQLPPKHYKDVGPLPLVSSTGLATAAPSIEPPISPAI